MRRGWNRRKGNDMSNIKKGVWLHNIPSLGGKKGIERFVKRYADAGFELLIPCVKNIPGLLDYHSKVGFVRPESREYDPLEHMASVARQAGIKIHAWYCNTPEGKEGRLLKEHPECVALTPDGKEAKCHSGFFTCLARPEVRDYEYKIMAEVVDNYDVAGVHLDYIRIGENACYCEICRAAYKRITRRDFDPSSPEAPPRYIPAWRKWRCDNVAKLVARIAQKCQKAGKELSAAVFTDYPISTVSQGQDFVTWCAQGYLDLVIPMNYYPDPDVMMAWTRSHAANLTGRAELWEGLGHFLIRRTSKLIEYVQLVKDFGVKGVVIFEHHHITGGDLKALSRI